jgi:hypothetical protein
MARLLPTLAEAASSTVVVAAADPIGKTSFSDLQSTQASVFAKMISAVIIRSGGETKPAKRIVSLVCISLLCQTKAKLLFIRKADE